MCVHPAMFERAVRKLSSLFTCALALAACRESPPGPVFASASAELQVRPRVTIDPNTEASDVNAVTAQWPISGTAVFNTTEEGVDVAIRLRNCRTGYLYPVSIHESSDCSSLQFGAASWDGARGALPPALCVGAPGASVFHTRLESDAKPWTLGGRAESNLVGRTVAIRDPDSGERLACGKIEVGKHGALAAAVDETRRPSDTVVLDAAGLCVLGLVGSDAAVSCPDIPRLAECTFSHCVAGCLDVCGDYLGCIQGEATACNGACIPADECNKCLGTPACALGFCGDSLACAPPPTPDGPCRELRECCQRQGPLVSGCMAFVELAESLGGDGSCLGTLYDWDFNTNVAYRSPCYPDGGVPEF